MINLHTGMKGFYRLEVRRPDGTVRETGVAPEFPNLILDSGLDLYGQQSGWLGTCRVGAGSTPPTVADTNLESQIAISSTIVNQDGGVASSSPYYAFQINTYRFAEGTAAGNISEVGVGSSTALFSRALVLDSGGTPTTITVLPDEVLDVTYELRYYVKETDDTGTVTFSGSIGGTYDYIFRACNAASSSTTLGWNITPSGRGADQFPSSSWRGVTGDIAPITGQPTGQIDYFNNITAGNYSAGSYEMEITLAADFLEMNDPLGVRCILGVVGIGCYQIQFDPAIPKTSDDTFSLKVKHTWGRA